MHIAGNWQLETGNNFNGKGLAAQNRQPTLPNNIT